MTELLRWTGRVIFHPHRTYRWWRDTVIYAWSPDQLTTEDRFNSKQGWPEW